MTLILHSCNNFQALPKLMPPSYPHIVSFGEILWDILPDGEFPGGAPANFSIHSHRLGAASSLISRIGTDPRGARIQDILESVNLSDAFVQKDDSLPTGAVTVIFEKGQPEYRIHQPAAWDVIEATPASIAIAQAADAFYFGTLAQRSPRSRHSLIELLQATPPEALRILDINLRAPYFSRDLLLDSFRLANVLKLNEAELHLLGEMLGLAQDPRDAMRALAERFDFQLIALTRGHRGSIVLHSEEINEHPGHAVQTKDPIGAGDAFTAALIMSVLAGWDIPSSNHFANEVAAFVTSQTGATPLLPEPLVSRLMTAANQPKEKHLAPIF